MKGMHKEPIKAQDQRCMERWKRKGGWLCGCGKERGSVETSRDSFESRFWSSLVYTPTIHKKKKGPGNLSWKLEELIILAAT